VKGWLWLSVLASFAGWSLSAIGQLNRFGYGVCLVAAAVGVFIGFKRYGWAAPGGSWRGRVFVRRFRRPLPAAFAILAALVLLGGLLYPPSNYSGLNYRLARTLQWIAHGQWFWIHTPVARMNDRACGFEWLSLPLVLFTHSDRALFLLNFLPFLLLPGLLFTVFTRLGVRARVAWHWMWLLPAGYDFLLQAGSIANDTFPAVYALAMVAFGCRAWVSRQPADVWHALLAGALLTGAKASNLPLLLVPAILLWPLRPLLRRHWLPTTLVLLLAAVVSFLPTAALNIYYLHDWSGLSTERAGLSLQHPLVGIWGNALVLLLNNYLPPLFPMAGWWNHHILTLLPHFLAGPLTANFEQGFHLVPEMPTEDMAGLGAGASCLLLASLATALAGRRPAEARLALVSAIPNGVRWAVLAAPWIALLVFTMKSGMVTPQRIIAPYYPLLAAALLLGAGPARLVRSRGWRWGVGVVLGLAALMLVLSPDRPLWPAKTLLARAPATPAVTRALQVYTVFSRHNDALAGVRSLLPAGIDVVGFVGEPDDCDISLWRPFGSRRVEHFLVTDPPELLRSRVEYVVVGGYNLGVLQLSLADWLQRNNAELIARTNLLVKLNEGPQDWYVTRLKH
jgi:hypothetical protein